MLLLPLLLLFIFLKYCLHGVLFTTNHTIIMTVHHAIIHSPRIMASKLPLKNNVLRHDTVEHEYTRCVNIYFWFCLPISKYYCNYCMIVLLLLRSWRILKRNLAHIEWLRSNANTFGTIRIRRAKKNIH